MSIFGTMKTAVAGMNAQANRLGTVGDNIANSSTVGYKRASTEFSSLVLPSGSSSYQSGGVTTNVRYSISEQGNLAYTTSSTDLAIQGNGFFVVQSANEQAYLTRAGAFQKDSEGYLVNSAGYKLMGYSYAAGTPAAVVNGFDGLVPIQIGQGGLTAKGSTFGTFGANLNADAAIVPAGSLPSDNVATSTYSDKSSLTAYDSLGREVLYDFYYTKTAANEWEVTVYRQDQATPGTGFPYTATAPASLVQETITLTFDPTNGKLTTTPAEITFSDDTTSPSPGQEITIDLSTMTQFGAKFTPGKATIDGKAANAIKDVEIDKDGTVYAIYDDSSVEPLYRIPLATVASPDKLTIETGNAYSPGAESGVVIIGFPNQGNFGQIVDNAVEESNVDLAGELTSMIEAQRSYTANSKVFQTGADIMDVLINLKR
ncbi:flagellar hook protein FlgE [Metarhizobium album]|uniref:Flagellar hook protein FlgE n=1 Tax=Metarhizobium album TaxID=2182425 RepID=A0A2U2DWY9_9HYPH|nr:flagellar hook protein FlgE [Rhizobium album]PWE57816.1 flagellar hook protein FlgE [Rhizobium album]